MKVLITGTPGTGKTTIAKRVAKKTHSVFINEAEFALKKGIAEFDLKENELELPLKKLQKELNKEIKKNKNVVVEGHTLCETKLNVDKVFVLRVDPELLEERLLNRNYNDIKVLDNVFCEGIDYCLKHAERNYKIVVPISNGGSIDSAVNNILGEMRK